MVARRFGLSTFLLLAVFICFSFSQDAGMVLEEQITFTPESTIVERGRNFTIALVLSETDPKTVRVERGGKPDGIRIIRGPYVRAFDEDATRVSYILRADRTGAFRFRPYEISVGENTFSTEPFVVSAGLVQNGEIVLPIEPVWRVSKDEVYLGEATIVFMEFEDSRTIDLVDSIIVQAPTTGVFEEASHLGSVTEQQVGPSILYRVPITSYAFTPTRTGRISIPSATVTVGDQQARTGSVAILVQPLPDELSATGAVGQFNVSSTLNRTTIRTGEETTLTVTVRGIGNFGYLRVPEPRVEGILELARNESQVIRITNDGYEGNQTVEYRYVAENTGNAEIVIPEFPWIDPSVNVVGTFASKQFDVKIVGAEEGEPTDNEEAMPFVPFPPERVISARSSKLHQKGWLYGLLFPGPLAAVVILLFRRMSGGRNRNANIGVVSLVLLIGAGSTIPPLNPDAVQRAYDAHSEGRYTEASMRYFALSQIDLGNPSLRYNLALSLFYAGDIGSAVHEARVAARLRPSNMQYRGLLTWINTTVGAERQIAPTSFVDVDYIALMLILSVNAFVVLAVVVKVHRKGGLIIAFILSGALLITSIVSVVVVGTDLSAERGVVMTDQLTMRRIPDERARAWRELPEGTSVEVKGRSERFVLVETGYGLKGWIDADELVLDTASSSIPRSFGERQSEE